MKSSKDSLAGRILGFVVLMLILMFLWVIVAALLTPMSIYGETYTLTMRALVTTFGCLPIVIVAVIGAHHIALDYRGQ